MENVQRLAETSVPSPDKSGIERIDVQSNADQGKGVSLVNGTMVFLYYESILQDAIRATVTYSDTGDTIDSKTAMEGLPITGQETVEIKVRDNNNTPLTVTLYVNKVTPLTDDTRKAVVRLDLASREYIWNEKVRVNKRFDGKISDHIKKILTEPIYLGTQKELDIEETSNNQNCVGNNKKPYYMINWLARGAVPNLAGAKKNTAGFFFWETAKKIHFKSIDSLFDTTTNPAKKKYFYNETPDGQTGRIPAGYDGKALEYSVDNKVNVNSKLKMGAYSTRLITFNPFNTFYEVTTPNAGTSAQPTGGDSPGNQANLKLAGKKLPTLNPEFDITEKGKEFSRTTYMVLDTGSLPEGSGVGEGQEQLGEKSQQENYKPGEVLNQGIMRMNQMFALTTTITIPGDFSLHAGDSVYVDAPELRGQDTEVVNQQTGGNYIISDLCHYMSPKNTLTKLILVRDSFGRKPMGR